MARRSPQNERYGKFTAPAGQTRKSAASAKPKRDSSVPQKKTTTKKKSAPARQPLIVNPPTPEFRAMRRTWWILLGGSLVFTVGSLLARTYLQQVLLANVLLVIGYAGIFAALYLDWAKLRPMRKEYMDSQAAGGKNKKTAKDTGKDGSSKDE